MLTPNHRIVSPAMGLTVNVLGDRFVIKVSGKETDGEWALFEVELSPGQRSPLHFHRTFDEVYYLLEGELEIQVGELAQSIGPGTLVQVPRTTSHQYANLSIDCARLLTWVSPAGVEALFEDLAQADPDQLADPAKMMIFATQYDIFLDPGKDL